MIFVAVLLGVWCCLVNAQKALDFSRVEKLFVASPLTTAALTVEAWVKLSAASFSSTQGILLHNTWTSNSTGSSFHFMFYQSLPRLSVDAIAQQGSVAACCSNFKSSSAYTSNAWMHVALTADADAGSSSLFINGNLIETRPIAFKSGATRKFMVCPCNIGNSYDGDPRHLVGQLGPVRLWKSARSRTQIQASMAGAPASGDDAVFAFDDYSMVDTGAVAVPNAVVGSTMYAATARLTASNPTTSDWPASFTTTVATTTTRTSSSTRTPATTTTTASTTTTMTTMRTSTTTSLVDSAVSSISPTTTTKTTTTLGPGTAVSSSSSSSPSSSSSESRTTMTSPEPSVDSSPTLSLASGVVTSSATLEVIVNVGSGPGSSMPDGPLSTVHIGIIVGVLALACLLAIVTAWCIARRRRQNRAAPNMLFDSLRVSSTDSSSAYRSHEYGRVDVATVVPLGGGPAQSATYGAFTAENNVEYDRALPLPLPIYTTKISQKIGTDPTDPL